MSQAPKFGKHILAVLTTGMYKDPKMIYREYIQNSADQIDQLSPDEQRNGIRSQIKIDIDKTNLRVTIKDSATGVPADEFEERLLNVADSKKDPAKNKGFRGIGRLAGLAYCHRLVFETSAPGETIVSRMVMDGDRMRAILSDTSNRCSAEELVAEISDISRSKSTDPDYESFFKVTLEGIIPGVGSQLLETDNVRQFLSEIAPVPFSISKFSKSAEIEEHAKSLGFPICGYSLLINGQAVTKPYKDDINGRQGEIVGKADKIVYSDMRNQDGKLLGWAWAAVPTMGKSIVESANHERKLRLRKENIQVGMSDFFDEYFPEARSNAYMIGEVYITDPDIRPNGDRNELEVSEASAAFIKRLKSEFFPQLWKAAREANTLSSARGKILEYETIYKKSEPILLDDATPVKLKKQVQSSLAIAYGKAEKGINDLKKAKPIADFRMVPSSAIEVVRESYASDISVLESKVKPVPQVKNPGKENSLSQETKADMSLANKVVKILVDDASLEISEALDIWKKIEKLLKK